MSDTWVYILLVWTIINTSAIAVLYVWQDHFITAWVTENTRIAKQLERIHTELFILHQSKGIDTRWVERDTSQH